jgi:hypothetical protein
MVTLLTRPPEGAETMATLIAFAGADKVDPSGKLEYPALRGVDRSVAAEKLVAIVGRRMLPREGAVAEPPMSGSGS